MKPMNDSYGIPRGSMPTGRIVASMASRFPSRDKAGNEETLVYVDWDGETLRFNPTEINGAPISLEQWESHATPQGKEFAAKIRAGYKPLLHVKELNEILATVIKHDVALSGYTPSDLPEAAKARIQNTLGALEKELSSEELDVVEKWTGGVAIFSTSAFECREGGCCYYVFEDGSLYFRSTGDSEVWSHAYDFADEKIINGYEGELDEMDAALLRHLGGQYEEELTNREVSRI